MLSGCQSEGTTDGSGEIDQADVLVGGMDPVDVHETGGNQCAGSRFGGGWSFPEQLDLQSAFLPGLAKRGLFRILVQFDVATEWKPFPQLSVEDDQNFSVPDDEHGDGEIDFLVEVWHGLGGISDPARGPPISYPESPTGCGSSSTVTVS